MLEKLHVFISLIAAIATVAYGVITDMSLRELALPFIIAIVVFYFAGLAVRGFLKRRVFKKEEPAASTDDDESSDVYISGEEDGGFNDDDDDEDEDDFDDQEDEEDDDEDL